MALALNDENEFFKDLLSLMGNLEFVQFRQKYMASGVDAQSTIMFMDLYETVADVYETMMGESLPDDVASSLLKAFMRKAEYRKPLVSTLCAFFDGNKDRSFVMERMRAIVTRDLRLRDDNSESSLLLDQTE